jgi:hypothetical protein
VIKIKSPQLILAKFLLAWHYLLILANANTGAYCRSNLGDIMEVMAEFLAAAIAVIFGGLIMWMGYSVSREDGNRVIKSIGLGLATPFMLLWEGTFGPDRDRA